MSNSRLEVVLSATNDVAYEWDFKTDQVTWYGAAPGLFEVTEAHIPVEGKMLQKLIHPDDAIARNEALSHHYTSGETYESEFRLRRNGMFGWVHERAAVELDDSGQPVRLMGVWRMIDERKQREASVRHSALFDSLTGQFNRARLLDSVNEKLLQTKRYNSCACYIVVGLNSYTPNMTNGHTAPAEDAIMIALSHQIESILRASDVIGRVGKREFGILLTSCRPGDLDIIAEKLLAKFRDNEVETTDGNFRLSLSAGGITLPGCALTGFDVMNGAEDALSKARDHGSDTFLEYKWAEDVSREYHNAVPVGNQVLDALKDERIEFAFQPVVHSGTANVVFYEALLRLWDDNRNLIAAKDFIPAVERLGFSRVIDRRTLDMALDELQRSPDLILALNISGITVSDPSWLRKLNSRLRGRPQLASRLIIEITETIAMKDMAQSIRFVNHVRELGCRVALDDFGAGFITFRHLKSLTVDIVKIDGMLIQNITENRDNQALVRTLVELAHAFKLEIVAEFIEKQEEADYLHKEGVHFLQGYYFGKPSFDRPWASKTLQPVEIRAS